MTNAEFIELVKNDDPNAQVDFKILYGNGELKPVVHGKWIEHIVRDDFDDAECVSYECNKCHCSYAEDDLNFCPHCGCQMDGE